MHFGLGEQLRATPKKPMNRLSEHKKPKLPDPDLEETAGRLNASQRRKLARKFLRWSLQLLDSAEDLENERIKARFDRQTTNRGGN